MTGRLVITLGAILVFVLPIAGLQAQRLWLAFHAPSWLALRADRPVSYWLLIAVNGAFIPVFLFAGAYTYWRGTAFLLLIGLSALLFTALEAGAARKFLQQGAWMGLDGMVRRRVDQPRTYRIWLVGHILSVAIWAATARYLLWQFIRSHSPIP